MAADIIKDYSILEVYMENLSQKVLLCKHKDTEELYLVNAITNKGLVEGLDYELLINTFDSMENIVESDEAIYFITKYSEYQYLNEYLSNNKLGLSSQVGYLTTITDVLLKLRKYPDYIISSFLDINNLYIDEKNNIHFTGLVILDENNLKISRSDVLRKLANITHVIFTGKSIENDKLFSEIPPDIEKLINKCLNDEYLQYEEFVNDFKQSNIYRLINPEEDDLARVYLMRKSMNKRKTINKLKKRGIIVAIILILLSPILVPYAVKMFRNINTDIVNKESINNVEDRQENIDEVNEEREDEQNITDEASEKIVVEETLKEEETVYDYFNEELIKNYTDENIGSIDNTKFYEGDSSVKIVNIEEKRNEFLVGVIDITNGGFSFLKERKIDVSMRLTSSMKADGAITLKIKKGNRLLGQVTRKINVPNDIWILESIDVNTGKADRIEIYLTTSQKTAIWVDSFGVDILK
ncbi:hypothetical protein [Caldisalinibacter kiritimatiensis]|uniref:Uncharacterized protein n=1 Tax=Caldisalinibacter kiritimatiensis TaxID=1304284 RepID=R1AV50_9FIRM|nr:hypothetical protein [Caldisalinibacter kiritimatiensis]EOD00502.1 hypothetical protein L21TH_1449 [Caldisalinibacter kiritimatiensis]